MASMHNRSRRRQAGGVGQRPVGDTTGPGAQPLPNPRHHSALGTRHSALGTRHSALGTRQVSQMHAGGVPIPWPSGPNTVPPDPTTARVRSDGGMVRASESSPRCRIERLRARHGDDALALRLIAVQHQLLLRRCVESRLPRSRPARWRCGICWRRSDCCLPYDRARGFHSRRSSTSATGAVQRLVTGTNVERSNLTAPERRLGPSPKTAPDASPIAGTEAQRWAAPERRRPRRVRVGPDWPEISRAGVSVPWCRRGALAGCQRGRRGGRSLRGGGQGSSAG